MEGKGEHTHFNLKPTKYVCMFSLHAYIFLQERIIVFLGVRNIQSNDKCTKAREHENGKERKKGEKKTKQSKSLKWEVKTAGDKWWLQNQYHIRQ